MFHLKFDFGILFHYHCSIRAFSSVFVMNPYWLLCIHADNEPAHSSDKSRRNTGREEFLIYGYVIVLKRSWDHKALAGMRRKRTPADHFLQTFFPLSLCFFCPLSVAYDSRACTLPLIVFRPARLYTWYYRLHCSFVQLIHAIKGNLSVCSWLT